MTYSDIGERFIRYASVFTQSEEGFDTTPSTAVQRDLAKILYEELKEMGAEDVFYDEEHCYVYASVPATAEHAPVIGLMAHMDTSNAVRAERVKPHRVDHYDGGDIPLDESGKRVLSPRDYPVMKNVLGDDLVVTDGTSVLGADDKAGVSAIMEVFSRLLKEPERRHGKVVLCFTPDEEVGNGVLNIDTERFKCDHAYTIDGGALGETSYESFNAAGAKIIINGISAHPGYAKGIMLNALKVAIELNSLLPEDEVPEKTDGRQGYYHLIHMFGSADTAGMEYLIRDHDRQKFEDRKRVLEAAVNKINDKYGPNTAELDISDTYYNMAEKLRDRPEIVTDAMDAMRELSIEPVIEPIRGGTDGCQLTFMGIPCPNLGTGGYNFHSRYEFASVDEMKQNVELILLILERAASEDR
ncbi:MAG: peptidase T [Lachnospiraceae bacterium]|nr:peptidase T [Lachnospiraceae bacterium]